MLLPNGSAIKNDVIEAFNKAVEANAKQGIGTGTFWNFVDADMTMDLSDFYSDDYIYECFEALADNFDRVNEQVQTVGTGLVHINPGWSI